MDANLFIKTFPRLFHMAHHEAWPSIRHHGLLSTSALLDLYEIQGPERLKIEMQMRPESVVIRHPKHGKAVIRDQKPIMNDARLQRALGKTMASSNFHRLLNSMVFFWVGPERLETLRNAVEYRSNPQLVLTLDTGALVERYLDVMTLCPMNSGSCKPMAHPRHPGIFQTVEHYNFDHWRRKKGSAIKAVVECTVKKGVLDVEKYLIKREIVGH